MEKYTQVTKGKGFSVFYPAALWSQLTPREQLKIVKFYNRTNGKKRAAAAGKVSRGNGATVGNYSTGAE